MKKHYDIVIAGGGVIGAACAYYLSKRKGLSIALVDIKRPGNASRASAGGLWAIGESVGVGCGVILFRTASARRKLEGVVDASPSHTHILPPCFFDLALASNALYPALYQELRERHDVDFKFEETGLKFIMYDDEDVEYGRQIASAIPHLQEQMRWLDAAQVRASEPYVSHEAIGALEFIGDHQVNPFRLTDAYTEAARQNGVNLYLNTDVVGVLSDNARVTGVVTREHGALHAATTINAGGAWAAEIGEWATGIRLPVRPVKGQIVLSEKMPKLLNGCITTSDCYIAQKDNGEILIGSTTEEKGYDVSTSVDAVSVLAQGAMRCIPELRHVNIKRCWAGLRPGTPDELPILGKMPGIEGYLNACGHFRTGILTSAITGVLIDKLVHNETLPLDITPFSAERFLTEEAVVSR